MESEEIYLFWFHDQRHSKSISKVFLYIDIYSVIWSALSILLIYVTNVIIIVLHNDLYIKREKN